MEGRHRVITSEGCPHHALASEYLRKRGQPSKANVLLAFEHCPQTVDVFQANENGGRSREQETLPVGYPEIE